MIKYILAAVLVILLIAYEVWNQKKIRDDEWYDRDKRNKDQEFQNEVRAFLVEIRTEPENTRLMLRKLAFDDLEMTLRRELTEANYEYSEEEKKKYNEQNRDVKCNLAGRIDGLRFALEKLNERKPKSYREREKQTDPSMPKEAAKAYMDVMEHIFKGLEQQVEIDKEWRERRGKRQRIKQD